jgi:hypothetical protein
VIGAGRSLSVIEVIDVVSRVTGAELEVTHGPARPGEMPAVIVDPSRAHASGWSPQFDFNTGVANVWEEWRDLEIEGALAFLPDGSGAGSAATKSDDRRGAGGVRPLKRAAIRRGA